MGESRHGPALGLGRDRVAVRDYDSRWTAEFERERGVLMGLLDAVVARIEHVGSTAVAGLVAKPLIDVALGFDDAALLDVGRARLLAAGYKERGDFGAEGGMIFTKGPGTMQTHLLHLVLVEDPQWSQWLAFRDALRGNAGLREQYAALKRDLADRFPEDRNAYLTGKAAFIRAHSAGR